MIKPDVIIAIDPGKSNGGICTYIKGVPVKATPIPDNVNQDLRAYFEHIQSIHKHILAFIEHQQLRPSDMQHFGKANNMGKLVAQYEAMKNLMEFMGIPYVKVHPKTWQSKLHFHKIKNESDKDRKNRYKARAQKWYPEIRVTQRTQDAILIMHFARFMILNDQTWFEDRVVGNANRLFDLGNTNFCTKK